MRRFNTHLLLAAFALAALFLAPAAFAQGSDACASAQAITSCTTTPGGYLGPFAFDNSAATDDGLDHAACDFFGTQAITNDVWFCWTSEFAADTVTVEACGLTGVDTKLAVYGPFADCATATAACPPGDAAVQGCNDDSCGLQSSVTFATPNAGEAYLIRLGTFPGAAGGTGSFDISCTVPVSLKSFSVD